MPRYPNCGVCNYLSPDITLMILVVVYTTRRICTRSAKSVFLVLKIVLHVYYYSMLGDGRF